VCAFTLLYVVVVTVIWKSYAFVIYMHYVQSNELAYESHSQAHNFI